MRGEQSVPQSLAPRIRASPPLARGTEYQYAERSCIYGITPACAGNSKRIVCTHTGYRDHPRLRGEQGFKVIHNFGLVGSPPLARGTVCAERKIQCRTRITPACAGNSSVQKWVAGYARDHPRLRGEQRYITIHIFARLGSPPLARGTVLISLSNAGFDGITPACAGNRIIATANRLMLRDHPRLRGEQASRT